MISRRLLPAILAMLFAGLPGCSGEEPTDPSAEAWFGKGGSKGKGWHRLSAWKPF